MTDDFSQQLDQILVISEQEGDEICTILGGVKEYVCTTANSIDSGDKLAAKQIFDLIIFRPTNQEYNYKVHANAIKSKLNLARCNLAIVSSGITDKDILESSKSGGVILIKAPMERADLLLKVSTGLRLKKLHSANTSFTTNVLETNSQLKDINNRLKKELVDAKKIQNAILPKEFPKMDNYEVAVSFTPLDIIGGDVFDVVRINDEYLGVFLGDVTGHGLAAALIGAMTIMALKYADSTDPAKVLEHINSNMARVMPEGRFVAATMACLNIKTNKLAISCGGQPSPIIWRAATQKAEIVDIKGTAVGMFAETKYTTFETQLSRGDKLILASDGITETQNMSGEMLNVEGVTKLLAEVGKQKKSIKDTVDYIIQGQQKFAAGRIIKDDITLLCVEAL